MRLICCLLLLPLFLSAEPEQPLRLKFKVTDHSGRLLDNLQIRLEQNGELIQQWDIRDAGEVQLLIPAPRCRTSPMHLKVKRTGYEETDYLILPNQSGTTHLILERVRKPLPLLFPPPDFNPELVIPRV